MLKKGDDMAPLTENDGSNTPVREIVFYNLTVNQRLGWKTGNWEKLKLWSKRRTPQAIPVKYDFILF